MAPMGGTRGVPSLVPWLFALSRCTCSILGNMQSRGDEDRDTGLSLAPGRGRQLMSFCCRFSPALCQQRYGNISACVSQRLSSTRTKDWGKRPYSGFRCSEGEKKSNKLVLL